MGQRLTFARPALLALLAMAAGAILPACVPASRLRQIEEARARLARENLDLRRDLAEARVRAEEAAEVRNGEAPGAAPSNPLPPAPTSDRHPMAPSAREDSSPGVSSLPPDVPEGTPQGFGGDSGDIGDEDLRGMDPSRSGDAAGAESILNLSRRYASANRPREAADALGRLIKDYPFSPLLPEAFLERGRLRLKLGEKTAALEDFDTVAEAFPGSPFAAEARNQGERLRRGR